MKIALFQGGEAPKTFPLSSLHSFGKDSLFSAWDKTFYKKMIFFAFPPLTPEDTWKILVKETRIPEGYQRR